MTSTEVLSHYFIKVNKHHNFYFFIEKHLVKKIFHKTSRIQIKELWLSKSLVRQKEKYPHSRGSYFKKTICFFQVTKYNQLLSNNYFFCPKIVILKMTELLSKICMMTFSGVLLWFLDSLWNFTQIFLYLILVKMVFKHFAVKTVVRIILESADWIFEFTPAYVRTLRA